MHSIPEIIFDKAGRAYKVDVSTQTEDFFRANIVHKRRGVGRISWFIEGKSLIIDDIIIFSNTKIPLPWWARLFPFLKWSPPSYRNRGLGTAMLRYIIAQAETLAVEDISGAIVTDDCDPTPMQNLISFYV